MANPDKLEIYVDIRQKILNDIQNLVKDFMQKTPDKIPILYIDIRSITREDTNPIPKITYKDCTT
jgi:hypothetical protein